MPGWTIIAVGVALAFGLVLAVAAARSKRFARAPSAPARPPGLSADELAQRLARLAQSPAPAERPAAMCYAKAVEPTRMVEYVCPLDGSRTQHSESTALGHLVEALPALRRAVQELPGLRASLDERAMCRTCSPDATPGITLVVEHPDGRVARTEGVWPDDLQLLREFLDGNLTHRDRDGAEEPLKNRLPRIRLLLGLAEKPRA